MTMMMNTRRLLLLQKTTSSSTWKITGATGGGIGGVRRGGNKSFGSTASLINRFDPPPMTATTSYHIDSSMSSIGGSSWTTATNPWVLDAKALIRRYKSTMVVQRDLDDDDDVDEVEKAEAQLAPKATATFTPTTTAAHDQSITQPFPSLVIGPDRSIQPQGSFAEAQAQVCSVVLTTGLMIVAVVVAYFIDDAMVG